MLRRYDAAVADLLSIALEGQKIPVKISRPRVEFGTQTEMFPERAAEITSAMENHIAQLPAMVLTRLNWTLANNRFNPVLHRKLKWSDDLNMVSQSQHPLPYDIPYQLDIWTKFRDDANVLTELTLIKFPRRLRFLTVDFGKAWGSKRASLFAGQVVDNTMLEPGPDRECRITIDFMLEAWLPLPVTSIRTVRKIIKTVNLVWIEDARGFDHLAFEKVVGEG